MAEFEEMLNSILSSPKEMEKIMGLARELSGSGEPPERESEHKAEPPDRGIPGLGDISPKMMASLGRLMGRLGGAKDDDKAALMRSMKPYLRPERQEALDRAVKIARIARVAREAMDELGGDFDLGL